MSCSTCEIMHATRVIYFLLPPSFYGMLKEWFAEIANTYIQTLVQDIYLFNYTHISYAVCMRMFEIKVDKILKRASFPKVG